MGDNDNQRDLYQPKSRGELQGDGGGLWEQVRWGSPEQLSAMMLTKGRQVLAAGLLPMERRWVTFPAPSLLSSHHLNCRIRGWKRPGCVEEPSGAGKALRAMVVPSPGLRIPSCWEHHGCFPNPHSQLQGAPFQGQGGDPSEALAELRDKSDTDLPLTAPVIKMPVYWKHMEYL